MDAKNDESSEKLITVPAVVGLVLIVLSVPAYFVLKGIGAGFHGPVAAAAVQQPVQARLEQPVAVVPSEPLQAPEQALSPSAPPPARRVASATPPKAASSNVSKAALSSESSEAPAPKEPPARVWPDLPAASFDKVKILVDHGSVLKERDAVLTLYGDRLSVGDRPGTGDVITVPYGSIGQAFFSRSKQPRWRRSGATEEVAHVDRGKLSLFRGDRNWLILTTDSRPVFLALDDSSVGTALNLLEQRVGLKIGR